MKIGDKIRFLNTTGGGIVKSFKGKDQVLVEDEDGFDVPAYIRECVVIGEEPQVHSSNKPKQKAAELEKQILSTRQQLENKPKPVVEESLEGEKLNVYLAFLPMDPKTIQQCGYETYFVNDSNYYLFFNYMSRENNSWKSRYNGQIEPNTKIFLEEFEKKDLNELERICVQLIAFKKDKPFTLKNAISVELRLDTIKFYKLHCFMENDFFDENAILCPIVRNDLPERSLLVSASDLQEAMQTKAEKVKVPNKPQESIIKKKEANSSVLEVDLHIDELLDDTTGMSNADMLHYQLDKFREVLNMYAGHTGQKIVFIHGKGDGVLRKAIEKDLQTRYKQYYFQDASFREYGYGATMVTIR